MYTPEEISRILLAGTLAERRELHNLCLDVLREGNEVAHRAVIPLARELQLLIKYDWPSYARPEQLPPRTDDWIIFIYLAGRGTGKTRSGAEWLRHMAWTHPRTRWRIIAPTAADARDTCVEGESGLLACLPPSQLERWNRSIGEVRLTNGSRIKTYSAEEPDRLRGPQSHGDWCDELAAWARLQETWDMAAFGRRLGKNPQVFVSTTPRPFALVRELVDRSKKDSRVILSKGSTFDNAANLAPSALAEFAARYEGTRLGQQELYAALLDDNPNALWTYDMIRYDLVTIPWAA